MLESTLTLTTNGQYSVACRRHENNLTKFGKLWDFWHIFFTVLTGKVSFVQSAFSATLAGCKNFEKKKVGPGFEFFDIF